MGDLPLYFFIIFLILETFWKKSASSNRVVLGDIAIWKSKFRYMRPFDYLPLIFFVTPEVTNQTLRNLWNCLKMNFTTTAQSVQSFESLSLYLASLWLVMCFGEFCPWKLPPLTKYHVLKVLLIYFAIISLFPNQIQFCFLRQIHELFLHLIALIFLC